MSLLTKTIISQLLVCVAAVAQRATFSAQNVTAQSVGSSGGWQRVYKVEVDRTKNTSANLSNFPVLLSGTSANFKGATYGGPVTSMNGYDIVVAADAACTTPVPWGVESWNPSAGTWKAHVLATSLNGSSAASNTSLYVCIGNSAIVGKQNVGPYAEANVYDTNYKMVLHMADNAANNTVTDATANAANGANSVNTSSRTATGQINGAMSYAGTSSDSTDFGIPAGLGLYSSAFAMEFWFNAASTGDSIIMGNGVYNGSGIGYVAFFSATFQCVYNTASSSGAAIIALPPTGSWHHYACVGGGGHVKVYLDGALALDQLDSNATAFHNADANHWYIGRWVAAASFYYSGLLDEVRLTLNTTRSSDWIADEVANQALPGDIGSPNYLIWTVVK